jgi:hypothetical protein
MGSRGGRGMKTREQNFNSNKGSIVIYTAKGGKARLEVKLEKQTVWLTQKQISELFSTERSVITKHLRNIFQTKELAEKSNVQKMHIAFSDKPVKFYNLDVVISIGYRVNSKRATQFRIWATKVLRNYLVKGYALNQKRLLDKQAEKFPIQSEGVKGKKVINSLGSSNMILNLSKMSNLPSRKGTSSIKAQASLIFNSSPLRDILADFRIYGTPAPETPFISKILSSGDCLNPNTLPSPKGIIVMSAPESMYMATSILRRSFSKTILATGLKTVPVIREGSLR